MRKLLQLRKMKVIEEKAMKKNRPMLAGRNTLLIKVDFLNNRLHSLLFEF